MAKQEEIVEPPSTGGTDTAGGSGVPGDDDIELRSLSCGELEDLFDAVRGQILVQIGLQEDTAKWRLVRRRSIQFTIDALWALANGIQLEHMDRPCPGSLT
jgi:hypothetical protein